MTPEELDRTIEFIIQHQAHVSANLDELSTQLKKEHRQRLKLQEWSMDLHRRLAELLEHQSRRLDWSEQFIQDWKT